jgi:molybdopterin-guanine dinucleotide biosynthesis protein A
MGGGDKALRPLARGTLLAHVIDRARPQVAALVLNANGDPSRFTDLGLPVAADTVEGFAGPLAGILTGLRWAQAHHPQASWVASFATDTPFFPTDLVARLRSAVARDDADLACAASAGRAHPVFGLWPVRLADPLEAALCHENMRKIDLWTARYRLARAEFGTAPFDPFFNVNTPDDLAEAERLLALDRP